MDRTEEFILYGPRVSGFWLHRQETITEKYLTVDIGKNRTIEVPDFCLSDIYGTVLDGYTTLAYHLDDGRQHATPRRLVRGAFSDFMRSERDKLWRGVVMGNGSTYYGAPGIIFDSDFNILLLMSSTIETNNDGMISRILARTCRISPTIFQHQDGVIEKAIIKKIIPFCATHVINSSDFIYYDARIIPAIGSNIKVIIDDVNNKFIRSVVPPKMSEFTPQNVHNILLHNISQILEQ